MPVSHPQRGLCSPAEEWTGMFLWLIAEDEFPSQPSVGSGAFPEPASGGVMGSDLLWREHLAYAKNSIFVNHNHMNLKKNTVSASTVLGLWEGQTSKQSLVPELVGSSALQIKPSPQWYAKNKEKVTSWRLSNHPVACFVTASFNLGIFVLFHGSPFPSLIKEEQGCFSECRTCRPNEVMSVCMPHTGCPSELWLGLSLYHQSRTYWVYISIIVPSLPAPH